MYGRCMDKIIHEISETWVLQINNAHDPLWQSQRLPPSKGTRRGGGYRNVGYHPLHRSSLNVGRTRGREHIPTSPFASILSSPSPARSCPPSAVLPPTVTRSRKGAKRRPRRQRRCLPHLGSAVTRRGAATRKPWRPLRPWPPSLLPLPSRPGRPGLPVTRALQRNGGPAVRRGAGRKPRPQRRPLLRRPAAADVRRAARTRGPLLPSKPPPPPSRGPTRWPRLQMVRHGFGRRNRRSNRRPTSRPRGDPPASSLCLPGPRTSFAFHPSLRTRWKARRWLMPICGSAAAASPRTASRFTTTADTSQTYL
jgi:hypothetical protein